MNAFEEWAAGFLDIDETPKGTEEKPPIEEQPIQLKLL